MSAESRGQRFANAMAAVSRRLPFGLSAVVPPNVVGYLLISGCTFGLDLGLLTLLHGAFNVIPPVAVTLSYGIACLVNYAVNRIFNFRSHGSLGTQLPVSIAIFTVNYLVFLLGVFEGLLALGVEYQLARILSACCEGVFLYCCMRWLVFRDARGNKPVVERHHGAGRPGPGHGGDGAVPDATRHGAAHAGPATAGIAPTPEAPHPVAAEPER